MKIKFRKLRTNKYHGIELQEYYNPFTYQNFKEMGKKENRICKKVMGKIDNNDGEYCVWDEICLELYQPLHDDMFDLKNDIILSLKEKYKL